MVQPRHHARHRDPVLSRPSAPDAARAQDDHRRGRRHAQRNACASCATRPVMWCRMRTGCSAAAAGRNCSAAPRRAIRASTVPIPRARISSSICGSGMPQSHPDEDFAETFAVWLKPRSNWKKRYAGWPCAAQARICRRGDGRDRGPTLAIAARRRRSIRSAGSRPRSRSTTARSRRSMRSTRHAPTTANCAGYSPSNRDTTARRPRHPFIRHHRSYLPPDRRALDRRVSADTCDSVLDDMIDRCQQYVYET